MIFLCICVRICVCGGGRFNIVFTAPVYSEFVSISILSNVMLHTHHRFSITGTIDNEGMIDQNKTDFCIDSTNCYALCTEE